uniref:Uncharacterized protein n=1 Tax=Globisporangium ultimum (strain ATCC 200006 / CBS 805.95 / DAOM BR144) TaxID=431595 RepID=K3WVU0_GLOUD
WGEHALQLHLQEQEALKKVHITKNLLRPSNTQQQYSPKVLEFIQWMNYKGHPDKQVTEAKTVLFITEIQNRPTRKTGRKQQQLAGSSQSDPAPYCARAIGYSILAAATLNFQVAHLLSKSC